MSSIPEYGDNQYPHVSESGKVPEGLYPPVPGFTHEHIIDLACRELYRYLLENDVDDALARETVFTCAALINSKFEEEFAEYQIAELVHGNGRNAPDFAKKVEFLAVYFSGKAEMAAAHAVVDSPLRQLGREFCFGFTEVVRDSVRDHILELKN